MGWLLFRARVSPDAAEAAAPWLPCVRPLARLDSSCWAAPASPPPVLCRQVKHPPSVPVYHDTELCTCRGLVFTTMAHMLGGGCLDQREGVRGGCATWREVAASGPGWEPVA